MGYDFVADVYRCRACRTATRQKFHDQVDPELPDHERWRRGDLLLKAHQLQVQAKGQAALRAKRQQAKAAS